MALASFFLLLLGFPSHPLLFPNQQAFQVSTFVDPLLLLPIFLNYKARLSAPIQFISPIAAGIQTALPIHSFLFASASCAWRAFQMTTKAHNRSKILRFITLPIRALGKAKDLYVRSVMDCAPRVSYGNSLGYPPGQLPILPKSSSTRSCRSTDSEDFRELVKAASVRSLEINNVDDGLFLQRKLRQSTAGGGSAALPKSCSVGMGRIDEDSASDFGDGVDEKADWVYSRSRSYAVAKRRGGF